MSLLKEDAFISLNCILINVVQMYQYIKKIYVVVCGTTRVIYEVR